MENGRLSSEFERISEFCAGKHISLSELVAHVGSRSQALLSMVLAVPFFILLPLPGISTIFGIIILISGLRIALNKSPWLPTIIGRRRISGNLLAKGFTKAAKVTKKIEKWVRPRGQFLHKNRKMQMINGFCVMICGFILAIPLPPVTNFLPAMTVFLISLGILEEDGLFISLGYFFFLLTLTLFTLLPILGFEGLEEMFSKKQEEPNNF
jgi:hypothetical protein